MFILGSPMGGHEPPPSPLLPSAMGEEPLILLACLMACQERTALLAHSLPGRLACLARPGLSWPAHRSRCVSNPPSPPGRQVDRCRMGAPEGPSPSLLCPLSSWPPGSRSQEPPGVANRQLQACRSRRRAVARAAGEGEGRERAEKGVGGARAPLTEK